MAKPIVVKVATMPKYPEKPSPMGGVRVTGTYAIDPKTGLVVCYEPKPKASK